MMDRETIVLEPAHRLAEGNGRIVYVHPGRPDVVIKIHKTLRKKRWSALRTLLRRKKRRFAGVLTSFVEIDEIAAMVARTGRIPEFTTQFVGFVNTNLGPGAMFEAVRAADGSMARTLEAHAKDAGHEPAMEAAITRLWDQIEAARAVVFDPNVSNVLVTGDAAAGYNLTLIDGLGERTLIRILELSDRAYAGSVAKGRVEMSEEYRRLTK